MKVKTIFILFFQIILFFFQKIKIQASTLDKIPSKYISDKNFIPMTLQIPTQNTKLFAAPKGHGKTCTLTNPCTLSTGISRLKPGYTLYLHGGEYNVGKGITIEKKGKPTGYIIISSVPGQRAIITSECNKSSGKSCDEITLFNFEADSSYIIIENLTFKNARARIIQGIVFYGGGQHHIIIRNNEFNSLKAIQKEVKEDYEANGILLVGEGKTSTAAIKNIIIYKNKLLNNVLGYSEAISILGNCENIYVLNNTLKSNTNIGIDFNGNTNDCKTANLDQPRNSVAMYNYIENSKASYDDCAGLYVDGAKDIYLFGNTVVDSQFGIEIGAEEIKHKNYITNIIVENNKLEGNTITGIRVGGYKQSRLSVKNTVFRKNKITKSSTSIIISKVDDVTFEENEIYDAKKYFIEMEFDESNTKNLKIEKNTFSGTGNFKMYGSQKNILSLKQFVNKYNTNKIK